MCVRVTICSRVLKVTKFTQSVGDEIRTMPTESVKAELIPLC